MRDALGPWPSTPPPGAGDEQVASQPRGDYGGGPTGLALALTARVARRAAGRAANVLARLDLRYKLVGSGLPKNYVVIARK